MAPTRSQAIEEVSASDHVFGSRCSTTCRASCSRSPGAARGWTQRAVAARRPTARSTSPRRRQAGLGLRDRRRHADARPRSTRVPRIGAPRLVQRQPARFDASQFDGRAALRHARRTARACRISWSPSAASTGARPALIHAYGGFRNAQTPTYLTEQPYRAGPLALFWVEQGNAFVLANIRGGGEYGPRWHEAGAAREAAEQLRRSPRRRRGSDPHRRQRAEEDRDFGPLQRRRAGRRGDERSGPTSTAR